MAVFGRVPRATALLVLAIVVALVFAFYDGIGELIDQWRKREEYSHGWLIAPIAGYLLWQRRRRIEIAPSGGEYWGLALLSVGVGGLVIGELATLYVIVHYALLLVVWGLFAACFGLAAMRAAWAPLVFLVFMIPLPPFLYNGLSGFLQLVSSALGVEVIRLFGISVFLEGNVIDLGSYKLQVVEACSGLRYLFPLMSFGFICAYLFRAPLWQRLVVFISAAPITVAMNSFRIGVIGILVEHWGPSMADGFLHDFEGWAIFMACAAILFLEMWLLTLLTQPGSRLPDVFWSAEPPPDPREHHRTPLALRPLAAALGLLLAAGAANAAVGSRAEAAPSRSFFSSFPSELGVWRGTRTRLEERFIEVLEFSDYMLADYRAGPDQVNFYVAYYDSQRKGESAHSPRSCIPGGGWEINDLRTIRIPEVSFAGQPARVNRVEIQMGEVRQLVYYWFQQRGRIVTNEYLVKAYLLRDALLRNRTDGALVRLTTLLGPGQPTEVGDARLRAFARELDGRLAHYIPN